MSIRISRCSAEKFAAPGVFSVYGACMYRPDPQTFAGKLARYATDPCTRFFLAEESGVPVGAMVLRNEDGRAEILGIAVSERHRGSGIGSSLIRTAEESECIREWTAETDSDAVGFYQKNGFTAWKREVRYPDGIAVRFLCTKRSEERK